MTGGGEASERLREAEEVGSVPLVDFGHLGLQFRLVTLHKTAGDDEAGLVVATFLGFDLLEDDIDALLFGVADEAAGVDDDGVEMDCVIA